jgi:hypothetical protein
MKLQTSLVYARGVPNHCIIASRWGGGILHLLEHFRSESRYQGTERRTRESGSDSLLRTAFCLLLTTVMRGLYELGGGGIFNDMTDDDDTHCSGYGTLLPPTSTFRTYFDDGGYPLARGVEVRYLTSVDVCTSASDLHSGNFIGSFH